MITLSRRIKNEVGNWVYRNARAIDVTRWLYHFEHGCPEAVVNVLAKYQNSDGGFGYGLEADSLNPNSAPIQTWQATEIIYEIRFFDFDHPIIAGILRYLDSGADFDGMVWKYTVPSNNDHPHAAWWHDSPGTSATPDYNPTAALAGFVLLSADRKSEVFEKCSAIARQAFDRYIHGETIKDMHLLLCYIRLFEYCEMAGLYDIIDLQMLRDKLKADVRSLIPADYGSWRADSYFCRPSQFFNSPDSIFYEDNRKAADHECDFILNTRNPEGVWDIPWSWDGFPKQWAISENWWKGYVAVRNMLYLRNFGVI